MEEIGFEKVAEALSEKFGKENWKEKDGDILVYGEMPNTNETDWYLWGQYDGDGKLYDKILYYELGLIDKDEL